MTTTKPAGELELGDLVQVPEGLGAYHRRLDLVGTFQPVTGITVYGARVVGIALGELPETGINPDQPLETQEVTQS